MLIEERIAFFVDIKVKQKKEYDKDENVFNNDDEKQ
jgi:hypothetical protein